MLNFPTVIQISLMDSTSDIDSKEAAKKVTSAR